MTSSGAHDEGPNASRSTWPTPTSSAVSACADGLLYHGNNITWENYNALPNPSDPNKNKT